MKRRDMLQSVAALGALSAACGEVAQAPGDSPAPEKASVTETPVILECAINGSTTRSI
jgi:hypothetical protein